MYCALATIVIMADSKTSTLTSIPMILVNCSLVSLDVEGQTCVGSSHARHITTFEGMTPANRKAVGRYDFVGKAVAQAKSQSFGSGL